MYYNSLGTLINQCSQWYTWRGICPKSGEFRMPGIKYHIIEICVIRLYMTYLQGRTEPAGGPVLHSPCTLLRTRAWNGWVMNRININTCSFVLIFCTCVIYIYKSLFLRLQTNRGCIGCPVESESGDRWPETQPPAFLVSAQARIRLRGIHLTRDAWGSCGKVTSFVGVGRGNKIL